jgi:hypothetical protein
MFVKNVESIRDIVVVNDIADCLKSRSEGDLINLLEESKPVEYFKKCIN